MPTPTNSIIYLYKGVPLLKGGTEVLYVYQDNAITQLEQFLHRTFFQYYYVREERQYVRIKATMPDVEGCNYLAFRNPSNGDKWFFGFIDRLVYINDNTVEIEFTIDPFPTYLGDTHYTEMGFIIRNTVVNDVRGSYLQDDYIPTSADVRFADLGENAVFAETAKAVYCYCGISTTDTLPQLAYWNGTQYLETGIKLAWLTNNNLEAIKEKGGVIIGAYMMPNWFEEDGFIGRYVPVVKEIGTLSGNPLIGLVNYNLHQKINTGVYNKVTLVTNQGSRNYELEFFSNVYSVSFKILGCMCPCPCVFIYPMNYKGVEHNLSEGILMKFPAIPISANSVYTQAQQTQDNYAILKQAISGAASGASAGALAGSSIPVMGTGIGALLGGGLGALGGALSGLWDMSKNVEISQFLPPTVTGSGEPITMGDYTLRAKLMVSSPSLTDLLRIDKYFSYYGYNLSSEEFLTGDFVTHFNTRDGAYLQTGSDILVGSEVDVELNARLKAGIKIRRTLTA